MNKLYNSTGIGMAAFLGGPLAAGYLFYKNYQTLSKKELSRRAIAISMIVTIVVFGSFIIIPEKIAEKIPNYLFPIIFLWIARLLVDRYQKNLITEYVKEGGEFYSNWRSAGISLLFAVLTFVMAMVAYLLVDLLAT